MFSAEDKQGDSANRRVKKLGNHFWCNFVSLSRFFCIQLIFDSLFWCSHSGVRVGSIKEFVVEILFENICKCTGSGFV